MPCCESNPSTGSAGGGGVVTSLRVRKCLFFRSARSDFFLFEKCRARRSAQRSRCWCPASRAQPLRLCSRSQARTLAVAQVSAAMRWHTADPRAAVTGPVPPPQGSRPTSRPARRSACLAPPRSSRSPPKTLLASMRCIPDRRLSPHRLLPHCCSFRSLLPPLSLPPRSPRGCLSLSCCISPTCFPLSPRPPLPSRSPPSQRCTRCRPPSCARRSTPCWATWARTRSRRACCRAKRPSPPWPRRARRALHRCGGARPEASRSLP